MAEADKPSVQGLMTLIRDVLMPVCPNKTLSPIRAYAERLASAAAPAAQPATPLREVLSDEQIKSELPRMPVFLRESLYDYEQSAVIAYVIQCARALLAQAQPLPVAALSDADRELMEQAIDALEDAVRVHAIHRFNAAKELAAIAALRSRLDGEKT